MKPRDLSLSAGVILASATLGLGSAGCQKSSIQEAQPPLTVGVVEAQRRTVPLEVRPNGTTRALESVTIRARVRGFLTARHFVEGAMVKKGQLLLVIDEEPYQIALQSSSARLAETEASLRKATESKEREVTAAQLRLDETQLTLAQIQERRSRALLTRRASPAEEVDKSVAESQRWENQVRADQAKVEQAISDYNVGVASARAQVAAATAAVRDAKLNLGYCRMYAPIDGRIGEARVKVGNLVGPDPSGGGAYSELATIQQLDPLGVDIWLSSRDLERTVDLMQRGLTVRLSRMSSNGPSEHPHEGRCYFIDNTVDETTSTFLAKAALPNPGGKLLPGDYVKIKMVVGQLENAIVVPTTAVQESEAGSIVYVVDGQGKVAVRRVVAGLVHAGMRVISEGLEAGAPVIVDGLQIIRPGMPVKTELSTLVWRAGETSRITKAEVPHTQVQPDRLDGAGS
jgi:membrane fusion protein, multidrug efflux system